MKLTVLFLTVGFLHVAAKGVSQEITFSGKNVSLQTALASVEKQTGVLFFYASTALRSAKPVTIDAKKIPLEQFLTTLFKDQPLKYRIDGKNIFITEKMTGHIDQKPEEMELFAPLSPVHGRVLDNAGKPLAGASVTFKNNKNSTVTDAEGSFTVNANAGDVLLISYVGYLSSEYKITAAMIASANSLTIVLKQNATSLNEVVVSNGYQDLPKERSTGSYTKIDNELLNRRVSPDILSRLEGVASGVLYDQTGVNFGSPLLSRNTGLKIRGISTISSLVSKDPLVIVDNFPYEGDIRNINPNDIESITILKDAAAASIWGARAGNGVIVLTTKKGTLNQKMSVDFNSNVTITNKPDIFYDKNFLNSSDFIDIETMLFDKGYFTTDLANTTTRPAVSPVIEILAKQKAGQLSAADAAAQINALRNNDVRNDYKNYFYHKAVNQQYSLGIRGGSNDLTYSLSVGHDNNQDNIIGNNYSRTTITSLNTYKPIKNLVIHAGMIYSQSTAELNGTGGYGTNIFVSQKYTRGYPYARLVDDAGNGLPMIRDYRAPYIDSVEKLGFLNWRYSPYDEIKYGDRVAKLNDVTLRASVKYQFTSFLNAEVSYQKEYQTVIDRNNQTEQTYFTRNLINRYAQYNTATKAFTYIFPRGSYLETASSRYDANNFRAQLNYNHSINSLHEISALIGNEIREIVTESITKRAYGYDDQFGTAVTNINYNTSYPTNPSGSATISAPPGNEAGTVSRFLSYYGNAGYTYDRRYTFNISGRKDGANMFGVNINNKILPLWSAGIGWNINQEKFYTIDALPLLKLRFTYGFSGNVFNGSALTKGGYSTSNITGAQIILNLTAPNPDLAWEKVRTINFGVDFATKNNRLTGTVELYQKDGRQLVEPVALPPSTGFSSFDGNAATIRNKGIDLTLTSKNVRGLFNWNTTLLFTYLKNKLLKYDVPLTTANISDPVFTGMVGYPSTSIFSYKWAGLDPNTGDPQGVLNKATSKDYAGIVNNFKPDSLQFHGSGTPTIFGALRNDFSYKGFFVSVNIIYNLGYYFRRPSISLNYQDLISAMGNADYSKRWQKPGDEAVTNIPSLVYPANDFRNNFYRLSSALVERADHIRLQDVQLGYDFTNIRIKKFQLKRLQVYGYANNIGMIWRANKSNVTFNSTTAVDANITSHNLPYPFSISFGIKANL